MAVSERPQCPQCGAPVDVRYVDTTVLGNPFETSITGTRRCPTPGCGTTCPICHREPGDIHSGACAPIVLRKLTDATRVSVDDCRQPVLAARKAP
jgi:hypothetical protein